MAQVADMRLCVAVRDIIVPKLTMMDLIALNSNDPNFDRSRFQAVIATYLTQEDGLRLTDPNMHTVKVGIAISYGPITADLDVMTI